MVFIESKKIEWSNQWKLHRFLLRVTNSRSANICNERLHFSVYDHNTSCLFAKLSQNRKQKKSNEIIEDRRQSSALALKFQKAELTALPCKRLICWYKPYARVLKPYYAIRFTFPYKFASKFQRHASFTGRWFPFLSSFAEVEQNEERFQSRPHERIILVHR